MKRPPGIVPILISGWAKSAFSLAYIMSHMRANSQPPPNATPLTAAMIGFRSVVSTLQSPSKPDLCTSTKRNSPISFISAPAKQFFNNCMKNLACLVEVLNLTLKFVLILPVRAFKNKNWNTANKNYEVIFQ
uniref:Uncharacterized protein n=1 Tax=Parascaris univalens TaxID=6257 RepID=A0A914ZSD7_PARUN